MQKLPLYICSSVISDDMKTLVTLIAFVAFSGLVNAQVLESIKGTAKGKLQSQDFNTGRSNKEKSGLTNKKSVSQEAPASTPEPESADSASTEMPASGTLNYKKEYSFDMKVAYDITDMKKKETTNVGYSYSDEAMYTVNKESQSAMITDYVNEVMITIDDESKSAMVMSSSFSNRMAGKMMDEHNEKAGKTTITKTGETKQILGKNCEKYIATSEDGTKIDMWITTDIVIDNAKIAASLMQYSKTAKPEGDYPESGTTMELTSYNKKGEAETHMIMTEFSETAFTKNLNDYRFTTVGF